MKIWCKDEFDDLDSDQREDEAYTLVYDSNVYRPEKGIGRTIRCPYPIDDNPRSAAKIYADWYHSNRDGWERGWPVEFVVFDGKSYFVVEVERDMEPVFLAGKPAPLEVESVASSVECLSCGLCFEHAPDRVYDDGEELVCSDCHARNVISIDDEGAYISFYICQHGKRDDEPCDQCEIEDGSGVGEVAP